MASYINTNTSSLANNSSLGMSQLEQVSRPTRPVASFPVDNVSGSSISKNLAPEASQSATKRVEYASSMSNEFSTSLEMMRQLAVESVNANGTSSDRTSLNNEMSQLVQYVDKTANSASFNGMKVFDGSAGALADMSTSNLFSGAPMDITTKEGAATAIKALDSGLQKISDMNRSFASSLKSMESSTVKSAAQETTAAKSEIKNVDMVNESVSKNNVRQEQTMTKLFDTSNEQRVVAQKTGMGNVLNLLL